MKALIVRDYHDVSHKEIRHVFLVRDGFDSVRDQQKASFRSWLKSLRRRFEEIPREVSDHYTDKDPTGGWGYPSNGW